MHSAIVPRPADGPALRRYATTFLQRSPMIAIKAWGDKYVADPAGSSVTLTHKACGHELEPVMACSHCGEAVGARDVVPSPGPGAKLRAAS